MATRRQIGLLPNILFLMCAVPTIFLKEETTMLEPFSQALPGVDQENTRPEFLHQRFRYPLMDIARHPIAGRDQKWACPQYWLFWVTCFLHSPYMRPTLAE